MNCTSATAMETTLEKNKPATPDFGVIFRSRPKNRKMTTLWRLKPLLLLFCSLVWAKTYPDAWALDSIVSFVAPAASAPAGYLSDFSVGFELYPGNEMYWWSGWGVGGEIPENCQIGYNHNFPSALPTIPVFNTTSRIAGVARDSVYFYFTDNQSRRIYRKVVWASQNSPATEIPTAYTPLASGYTFGAAMLWNGRFYWSDSDGSYFDIMSYDPNSGDVGYVRRGSGKQIVKLVGHTYGNFFSSTDAIFALTATGDLWRMDINPPGPLNVLLATNVTVTDFAIRDESQFVPPISFKFFTTVYASTGQRFPNSGTPPGTLLAINAAGGSVSTIYTAPAQDQITAVTADSANIYWTEQPVTCNPPFACLLGDYSLYRQSRAPDYSSPPGSVDLIGLPGGGAGLNLRSDGDWLYFLNSTTIKRLATGTPKVQLNIKAEALEVVQAIQNLDSQVPLVAGHETYVRGYARLDSYSFAKIFYSTAVLHGFRNGTEFPDSPIYPVESVPMMTGAVSLAQLRGDMQHSFLFRLPASWVKSGSDLPAELTFTMTANPDLGIPETAAQPLSDNTVSLLQPATLIAGLEPCLVTVPLVSKGPIYQRYNDPFGFVKIMGRALSLLPAAHLNVQPFLVMDPVGDWNNPFDFADSKFDSGPDAWDDALGAVDGLHLWSDPCQGGDEHFVGMVHPLAQAGSDIGGIGRRPGKAVVVTFASTAGNGHSTMGGTILAHELGHNYGRRHINCGGFPSGQANFDLLTYPCSLGNPDTSLVTSTFGYDPIDNVAIPPNTAADLMSYASPDWVSAYNWDNNLGLPPLSNVQQLPPANGGSPSPQLNGLVMLVIGLLHPGYASASLAPSYVIPQSAAPAQVLADSRRQSAEAAGETNPVFVVFLDIGGNTLSQVAIAVDKGAAENRPDRLRFGQYVDVPASAQAFRLVQGGQVLAERFFSPNAPTLAISAPVIDSVAGTLHLSWSASDPDGDPLRFTLQYSTDNGATWSALRTDYPYLEITFGTSLLPGGAQCLLRVLATDGANTAIAATPPFTMPVKPPTALIGGVTDGQRLDYGSEASLLGSAINPGNGSQSNQFQWTISGPTPTTSSNSVVALKRLSPGDYTATLNVTAVNGLVGNAVRDFQILPLMIPDGIASDFDGMGDSDGYTNSTYIPLPLEDGSLASARLYHASGKLYVGFYNLKYGGGSPRSVGVLIDPTATPPAAPGTNDFAFFVNENGSPLEDQGTGVSFLAASNPPLGFATAIYRGSNTWSAELSIPDTQLGGWGHLGSLLLQHGRVSWPSAAVAHQPSTWSLVLFGTNMPSGSNRNPVANAGVSLTLSVANSLTLSLDGSESSDPDGDALTYVWTQTGGPSITLTSPNTATPTLTVGSVNNATTFTFQLVVNDGSLDSIPSQVAITLLPPLAKPTTSQPLGGASLRSDGTLLLELVGPPNQPYQIQASSNLVSWVNLNSTVYSDYAGRIAFEESIDRTNFPQRFYRAVSR